MSLVCQLTAFHFFTSNIFFGLVAELEEAEVSVGVAALSEEEEEEAAAANDMDGAVVSCECMRESESDMVNGWEVGRCEASEDLCQIRNLNWEINQSRADRVLSALVNEVSAALRCGGEEKASGWISQFNSNRSARDCPTRTQQLELN